MDAKSNELILTVNNTSVKSIASQLNTSTMITYKIEKYPNDMQRSLKETPNNINRKKMKEVVSKTKKTMQTE